MATFKDMYLFRLLSALRCVRRSGSWDKMSALRRRRNIRKAADVSLALACKGSIWSRALFSHNSSAKGSKMAALRPLGLRRYGCKTAKSIACPAITRKAVGSRKEILQNLVPGGTSMNTSCLLKETADYIVALQDQVQVMRFLTKALALN